MLAEAVRRTGYAISNAAFLFAGLGSVLLVCWHCAEAVDARSTQLFARHTARLAFALFVPVFVAGPLYRGTAVAWARTLARQRRRLGLAFALAHFIHLGALTSFFVVSGEKPDALTLIFGGLGYVLLALLAVTSNDRGVALLGRRWKTLHRTGIWYLWFIFTFSYAGRVFTAREQSAAAPSDALVYQALLAVCVAMAVLRGAVAVRARR